MASRVFIQNNASYGLEVAVQLGGRASELRPGTHYTIGASYIAPGDRQEVLRFNRNSGITRRQEFFFTQRVTLAGTSRTIDLRQRLVGTLVHSTLCQTVGDDPWRCDGQRYDYGWAGDIPLRIAYQAYGERRLQVDHDIQYVFTRQHAPMPMGAEDPRVFNVLAYNIYMRPQGAFRDGQGLRVDELPDRLRGYDVLILSELFDVDIRVRLLGALRRLGYRYQTGVLGDGAGRGLVLSESGGVVVVSRWPLTNVQERIFATHGLGWRNLNPRRGYNAAGELACYGSDCRADKGILYAVVQKREPRQGGQRYHLFATHLQADNSRLDQEARRTQLRMLRQFIDELAIPAGEPVLIGGDLNVDRGNSAQYAQLLEILAATHPPQDGHAYTYDPLINPLALEGLRSFPTGLRNPAAHREYLDYVLYSHRHRRPTASTNEVRMPQSTNPWKPGHWDLSDHFALYGQFRY